MKILFVHQNFPGQYKHLAAHFARNPKHQVVSIGERKDERAVSIKGMRHLWYDKPKGANPTTHVYLQGVESAVRRGQAVVRTCLELRKGGFVPEVICAHPGWGEALYLKEVFPEAKLLNFYEFYYGARGSDLGFDPEFPTSFDDRFKVPTRNATHLLSLATGDWGVSPTHWQREQFPPVWRAMISVVHDGIETRLVRPDPRAVLKLEKQRLELSRKDEVITYVSRNLEPYRGFHTFMRALPEILKRRPRATVLIIGGDEVSYGRKPTKGKTWREVMMAEVGGAIDPARVHFTGKVPYVQFLQLLQISSVHVYLTVPFVLSWSLLEAMAAGCLIVASGTPPVREVMDDGVNGLLVDFLSPAQVAGRVEEALVNQDRLQPLRERARQTVVERYDLLSVCLPQQLALIEWLAGRKAS